MFTGAPLGATQFDILAVPAAGGQVAALVATDADESGATWISPLR